MSPSLIVGPAAPAVRRRLGPLAWVALEVAVSAGCDGVAVLSARSVAAELGMSKDTAARSLGRLIGAALIERIECHGEDGRFTLGRYRLRVAPEVLSRAEPRPPVLAPSCRGGTTQLSLLETS